MSNSNNFSNVDVELSENNLCATMDIEAGRLDPASRDMYANLVANSISKGIDDRTSAFGKAYLNSVFVRHIELGMQCGQDIDEETNN